MSVRAVVFVVAMLACNEHKAGFTQDIDAQQPQPLLPPAPVEVSGLDNNSGVPRVITDEELEDLPIDPNSAVAGLVRTFTANPSHSSEVRRDFRYTVVDSTVEMSAEVTGESRGFKQLVRPLYTSRYQQSGTYGDAVTESFRQNEKGILDILMVIDNSASMKPAQENIAQGLPALLNYVADSNWQIAIVSTDRRECIRRIITAETVDYERVFAETIKGLGIRGSSAEEVILMAQRGLRGVCQDKTSAWLRDNSSVALILVSDEDHQCYKSLTYKNNKRRPRFVLCNSRRDRQAKQLADFYQPIDELYTYLQQIRELGSSAKIYGIVNPNQRYNEDNGWLRLGSKWFNHWRSKDGKRKLFDQQANIFSDRAGYDAILQNISADISVILKDQFVLQLQPSSGTMVVKVTGADGTRALHPDEYMVNDSILTLNFKPEKGATIDVEYAHNAEPDVMEFLLPQLPLPGSVSIEIDDNGEVTTADTDSYMRIGQKIVFHSAPPKGATLTISYKKNQPLRSSLQLGAGRITELVVTVDAEVIDNFTLDTTSNLITFAPEALPSEGAVVQAVYSAILEENLSYPVARHDALRAEDSILCFNADDLQVQVDCAWQRIEGKDYVLFGTGEFELGRKITVRQLLDVDTNNIEMEEHYLPETIRVQIGTEVCYASDLVIENRTIVLDEHLTQSLCPHLRGDQQIVLNYDYIDLRQSFAVERKFFDAHAHEYEHWDIKVDGEKVTDFKITDHRVEFGFRLPPDAVVEITISLY